MHRQWEVIWSYMIHCRLLATLLPSKPISWLIYIFIILPPLVLWVCHSCFCSSTCALFLFLFQFSACILDSPVSLSFILPLLYPSLQSQQLVWVQTDSDLFVPVLCLTQSKSFGPCIKKKLKIFIFSESNLIKWGCLQGWTMKFGCEQRRDDGTRENNYNLWWNYTRVLYIIIRHIRYVFKHLCNLWDLPNIQNDRVLCCVATSTNTITSKVSICSFLFKNLFCQ